MQVLNADWFVWKKIPSTTFYLHCVNNFGTPSLWLGRPTHVLQSLILSSTTHFRNIAFTFAEGILCDIINTVEVKFTWHNTNHVKVNDSEAFSRLTTLHNYPLYLVLEYLYYSKISTRLPTPLVSCSGISLLLQKETRPIM